MRRTASVLVLTLAALLAAAFFYTRGWLRLQSLAPHRFPLGRLLCFLSGLLTLSVALFSPLDAFANFLLAVHMVQHLLLTMVVPPLLLLGAPYLPILLGLPRAQAHDLIVQAAIGAAVMLRDSGEHPVKLREAVTSPAGTTISAIRELENHGVRAALIAALEAARDRSRELASGNG